MTLKNYISHFLFCISLLGCEDSAADEQSKSQETAINKLSVHDALPQTVNVPEDNLPSYEKIELGRLLFYDPILSGNKDVACASCHHPNNGYAEYKDLSIGVNGKGLSSKRVFNQPNDIPFVKRNAHTVLNTAFNGMNIYIKYSPEDAPMFWDDRAKSLEKQAIEPILAMAEIRGNRISKEEIMNTVIDRLNKTPGYVALFKAVFQEPNSINQVNIGKAIAAFERTLNTTDTRFDQYMRGDKNAISLSELEGFQLFNKIGCGNCHNGPMFSDFKPHVLRIPHNDKLAEFDKGIDNKYAFRTPSLRNLRFTAPYMHNGKLNTLKEVLEFYEDISGGKNFHPEIAKQQVDTLVTKLELTVKEMGPIISFLNTLSDDNFDKKIPKSLPSGLMVGGNIK